MLKSTLFKKFNVVRSIFNLKPALEGCVRMEVPTRKWDVPSVDLVMACLEIFGCRRYQKTGDTFGLMFSAPQAKKVASVASKNRNQLRQELADATRPIFDSAFSSDAWKVLMTCYRFLIDPHLRLIFSV